MSEILDIHCVKAIINLVVFLEYSAENSTDPDAVVSALEDLACELQLMTDHNKKTFVSLVEKVSYQYDKDLQNFIRDIPINLGLV